MRLSVPVVVRWSDLDAYGHVNNARLLTLLEEARVTAFWDLGDDDRKRTRPPTAVVDASADSDTITLIAHQEIEYLAPVPYHREPLDVQLWIGQIGGASLSVSYEVRSPADVTPSVTYARASTTVVLVDAATGKPRRVRPYEHDAWAPYVEEPVQIRRR